MARRHESAHGHYLDWTKVGLETGNDLSQSGLARALGVDRSAISKMLKGERGIRADELGVIARYLGVEVPMLNATKNTNDQLFAAAEDIRAKAYAPYSRFSVGAAILADDGQIYKGCNIENAAYPQGNCAEASAIAAMIAGGARRIKRIYVTGPGSAPVTPCGGCRQRIREFADLDVVVISHGVEGEPLVSTLAELLPHSFGPEYLPG